MSFSENDHPEQTQAEKKQALTVAFDGFLGALAPDRDPAFRHIIAENLTSLSLVWATNPDDEEKVQEEKQRILALIKEHQTNT